MLAAAAVDAMLARDAGEVDPDFDRDRLAEENPDVADFERAAEEGPAAIFEEGSNLIREVAMLFEGAAPPILGLCPPADRTELAREVEGTVGGLLTAATGPATELARGMVVVSVGGVGELLSAVMHADVAAELTRSAERLGKHSPRFLREHVAKIATLRSDQKTVDDVADRIVESADDELREGGAIGALLRGVAAPVRCVGEAEWKIHDATIVTTRQAEELLAGLTSLQAQYDRQMDWLGRSARWLRRGARFLAHLGALAIGPLSSMPSVRASSLSGWDMSATASRTTLTRGISDLPTGCPASGGSSIGRSRPDDHGRPSLP